MMCPEPVYVDRPWLTNGRDAQTQKYYTPENWNKGDTRRVYYRNDVIHREGNLRSLDDRNGTRRDRIRSKLNEKQPE